MTLEEQRNLLTRVAMLEQENRELKHNIHETQIDAAYWERKSRINNAGLTQAAKEEPKPDFHVKLQSDSEQPRPDGGRSLITEVQLLRDQVAQLCAAVRGLVQLQSVLNTGVQQLLKNNGANFEVI